MASNRSLRDLRPAAAEPGRRLSTSLLADMWQVPRLVRDRVSIPSD